MRNKTLGQEQITGAILESFLMKCFVYLEIWSDLIQWSVNSLNVSYIAKRRGEWSGPEPLFTNLLTCTSQLRE